jgi:hypothetical protein
MFRRFSFGFIAVFLCGATLAQADPKADLTAAIQKLADADNYTWKSVYGSAAAVPPAEFQQWEPGYHPQNAPGFDGKLRSDGLVLIRVHHPDMRFTDWSIDCFIHGGEMAVHTLQRGWKSADEIRATDGPNGTLPASQAIAEADALLPPPVDARQLVEHMPTVQFDGDAYYGELPQAQALQVLLNRKRQIADGEPPQITHAGAKLTFWVKGGMLTKYRVEWSLEPLVPIVGIDTIPEASGHFDGPIAILTQIGFVNSTTIDVPIEATTILGDLSAPPPPPTPVGPNPLSR